MNALDGERRIVSLVPSLTHMLCDFGLKDALVGITQFCVLPPGLGRSAAYVGGTKDPDLDQIAALRPTHILVNVEENKPEHIAFCQALAATFVCFPKSPRELPRLLREVGEWLGSGQQGELHAQALEQTLATLDEQRCAKGVAWLKRRYLYLIWREPYMVAGHDSYIAAMLDLLGWENAAPTTGRYPTVTVPEMRELAPDLLLLSSEPYPFRKRDAARLRTEWGDAPPMLKVDGQLCSWYGTLTRAAVQSMVAWLAHGDGGLFQEFHADG